jgi:hypothetical protein
MAARLSPPFLAAVSPGRRFGGGGAALDPGGAILSFLPRLGIAGRVVMGVVLVLLLLKVWITAQRAASLDGGDGVDLVAGGGRQVRWRCLEAGDGVVGGGLGWPARDGRRRGGPT